MGGLKSKLKNSDNASIFKELCFCITTANCAADKCWAIQNTLDNKLIHLDKDSLQKELKNLGYRFPPRAERIVKARRHLNNLKEIFNTHNNEKELRKCFKDNIFGFGMKESSHFLRNIGYKNLAIVDSHILDVLHNNNIFPKPKTITEKRYEEIENILEDIAKKLDMSLAELDLYLWYMETGKVLK